MTVIIRLVPTSFDVPETVQIDRFLLKPLGVADIEEDFETVQRNADYLSGSSIFGVGHIWPKGITKQENLADLGWHEVEFRRRSSFAYRMSEPDGSYAGCLYILPSAKENQDAEVYFWVTEDLASKGVDALLEPLLVAWIENAWPFKAPLFPGRKLSWTDYSALPNRASAPVILQTLVE